MDWGRLLSPRRWNYRPSWKAMILIGLAELVVFNLMFIVGFLLFVQDSAAALPRPLQVVVGLLFLQVLLTVMFCPPWTFHLLARLYGDGTEPPLEGSATKILGSLARNFGREIRLGLLYTPTLVAWLILVIVSPWLFGQLFYFVASIFGSLPGT